MIFSWFNKKSIENKEFLNDTTNSNLSKNVLVVGVGNPGKKYQNTRHNMGFLVLDELQKEEVLSEWKTKHNYVISSGAVNDASVTLIKPQTFMNKSGDALREYFRYHTKPTKIIVVHDDMDMTFGKVRVQYDGGTGGHNGVISLAQYCDFGMTRVKIGIVSEEVETFRKRNPSEFVLSTFIESERNMLPEVLSDAVKTTVKLFD